MFRWMYKGDNLCVYVCVCAEILLICPFFTSRRAVTSAIQSAVSRLEEITLKKKKLMSKQNIETILFDLWGCHLKILTFDICHAASEAFKAFSQYLKARINLVKLHEHVVLPCHTIHDTSWYLHSLTWKSEGSW